MKFLKNILIFLNQIIRAAIIVVLFGLNSFSQKKANIHLKYTLWDYETGLDLPTKISTYWRGEKILESNNINEIVFSKNTDTILFESSGYMSIKFPVHFFGSFEKESFSSLSLKTLKLGNPIDVHNYLIFCNPNILNSNYKYEKKHYQNNLFHCSNNISVFFNTKFGSSLKLEDRFQGSEYQFLILTNDNLLTENRFYPQKGLNFIDFNVYTQGKTNIDSNEPQIGKITHRDFDIKMYFFDQGKYDLMPENKIKLDSLVFLLKDIPNYSLKIKGFTDRVGDADKNITLGEYRAKVVANYLKINGVNENRVVVEWEKIDEIKLKNNIVEDLKKHRKVEIIIKL